MSAFVSTAIVARALGVTTRAVTGWCAGGSVTGAKQTPGGRWLIPRSWFERMSEKSEAPTERQ